MNRSRMKTRTRTTDHNNIQTLPPRRRTNNSSNNNQTTTKKEHDEDDDQITETKKDNETVNDNHSVRTEGHRRKVAVVHNPMSFLR